jgi:hypothetical protein
MKNRTNATFNIQCARAMWGHVPKIAISNLKSLTDQYGLSVARGDLQFLNGRWYVTHSGLLGIASRGRCVGITTAVQESLSDQAAKRWVFRAVVHKSRGSSGFVAYGDADPSNVSPLVRGAEMRVAETRAVNRALRKAYGIGLCSVEELGWQSEPPKCAGNSRNPNSFHTSNGSNGNPSRLRDQLCLLIRQYNLDPSLVKAYAADFCGTETLKGASRELVESFISHLSSSAKKDLDGLICKLNSFSHPVEEVKQ